MVCPRRLRGRGATVLPPLPAAAQQTDEAAFTAEEGRRLFRGYCVACHNDQLETAGFSLEGFLDHLDATSIAAEAETWERVVQKLRTATMPPSNRPQPSADERTATLRWLTSTLDAATQANPNPGRTETLRHLNRTEYRNAIRDLLALDIDAQGLLPPDESGHGFDNVILGDLPPALLDRYVSAARRISALAVGGTSPSADSVVIRVPADMTQEAHVPGLPIGTRGGIAISHTFRSTASTTFRSGWRVTGTAISAACGIPVRTNWRCCSTAGRWPTSRCSSRRSSSTTDRSTPT